MFLAPPGHPIDAPFQLFVHAIGVEAHRPSVPGQHPFASVIEQTSHGDDLLAPRVPAGVAESIKALARLVPRQMIAGEEKLLTIEKDRVALGVPRCLNHQQLIVNLHRLAPSGLHFNRRGPRTNVIAMQDACTAEALMELLMIGNVVLMREHHRVHAAHRLHPLHEWASEAWRIDEHVAVRTGDEVAEGAEGALGRIATAIDIVLDELGIAGHRGARVVLHGVADRGGGTGDQRLLRLHQLLGARGLMVDRRLIADVVEHRRRNLPASVAIDARCVDEEWTRDIRLVLEGKTCHAMENHKRTGTLPAVRGARIFSPPATLKPTPVFDNLSDRMDRVFKTLRGEAALNEWHIENALKEIRVALLEADVHFKVVKDFTNRVREKAVGQDVLTAFSPAQQVTKVVRDELQELLGGSEVGLALVGSPAVVMMVGLQGSGKTTTAGKLALHLKNRGRRPFLVPCDVYRPSAIVQLRVVAIHVGD